MELKKQAIYIFFQNLHLLSFPTIYSLPCFPLNWCACEFFPRGHPRRSGVTLSSIMVKSTHALSDSLLLARIFLIWFVLQIFFSICSVTKLFLAIAQSASFPLLLPCPTKKCKTKWFIPPFQKKN